MKATINHAEAPVDSITLEVSTEEFFILAALQHRYLGGLHPVRDDITAAFNAAFAAAFPGAPRHATLGGTSSRFMAEKVLERFPR
jgi:hypothetical protein